MKLKSNNKTYHIDFVLDNSKLEHTFASSEVNVCMMLTSARHSIYTAQRLVIRLFLSRLTHEKQLQTEFHRNSLSKCYQ